MEIGRSCNYPKRVYERKVLKKIKIDKRKYKLHYKNINSVIVPVPLVQIVFQEEDQGTEHGHQNSDGSFEKGMQNIDTGFARIDY